MEDDRSWKVLKSEYLIKRPWLTARKDCVQLPSGVVNDEYYVLEYPSWVNVIARTDDGKYVFVRQYRHGLGETSYELCAGVVDPSDESPLAAIKRELWEETGYGGGQWTQIMKVAPNPSAMANYNYCFLAEGVERVSTQHLEPTEDITVHLFDEERVLELLSAGELKQSLMVAPLYKYFYEKMAKKSR